MRSCSFKPSDLYPLLGLGHRPWIREGAGGGEQEGGHNGNQMFEAGGGLASPLLCDKSHRSPLHPQPSKVCHSSLESFCLSSAQGGGKESGERLNMQACTHTWCTHARTDSPGSAFFLWPTFLNGPGRLNRCYLLLISVHLN